MCNIATTIRCLAMLTKVYKNILTQLVLRWSSSNTSLLGGSCLQLVPQCGSRTASSITRDRGSIPDQQEKFLQHWSNLLDGYEAQASCGRGPGPGNHSEARRREGGSSSSSSAGPETRMQHIQSQEHVQGLVRVFSGKVEGGMVPERLSRRLVHFYSCVLQPEDRPWFFRMLTSELGLNAEAVNAAVMQWQSAYGRIQSGSGAPAEALYRAADKLGSSTRPMYTQLLLHVSQLEGGIEFLVRMRADLLAILQQQPAFSVPLRGLSEHLRQALASWFSLGLLQLHRISWHTCSGDLLEKIMKYEAVHPMQGWADLKRRLEPRDRRVFAFMHACLPGEPLVVLHTALMAAPAACLQELLPLLPGSVQQQQQVPATAAAAAAISPQTSFKAAAGQLGIRPAEPAAAGKAAAAGGEGEAAEELAAAAAGKAAAIKLAGEQGRQLAAAAAAAGPAVAVFYSISSTQPGLSGVDLGHFLIKSAAELVQAEFPSVKLLVTLSPVPNFRSWLLARLAYEAQEQQSQEGRQDLSATNSATPAKVLATPSATLSSLLSEADGAALLEAAWSLSQEQQQLLLAAAGLKEAAAAAGEAAAAAAAPLLLPPARRASLLSAWLTKDLWRSCRPEHGARFRSLLLRIMARYLVRERRRNLALDPVANFHIRNGAQLWRINWGADVSEHGMRNSFGIMVNYRYDLDQVYRRNQEYLVQYKIDVSQEVEDLLGSTADTSGGAAAEQQYS